MAHPANEDPRRNQVGQVIVNSNVEMDMNLLQTESSILVAEGASSRDQPFTRGIRSGKSNISSDQRSSDSPKTVCKPVGPRCDVCSLSEGLCPSAQRDKATKNRKPLQPRTETVVEKGGGVKKEEETE